MHELLLLIAALAGVSAWLWAGYHEYCEAVATETADEPPRTLSDPDRAFLSGPERSSGS